LGRNEPLCGSQTLWRRMGMTEHKPGHTFFHEAHRHTQTAQEIIHELLDGPDQVDVARLDEAAKALRNALRLIDPDMDAEKL
jgi:hypothetical protein